MQSYKIKKKIDQEIRNRGTRQMTRKGLRAVSLDAHSDTTFESYF